MSLELPAYGKYLIFYKCRQCGHPFSKVAYRAGSPSPHDVLCGAATTAIHSCRHADAGVAELTGVRQVTCEEGFSGGDRG
jgi:hypothetical protein